MAEQHQRCRFWPLCAIHTGHERPPPTPEPLHEQIRQAWIDGGGQHYGAIVTLARQFAVSGTTIRRALAPPRSPNG